MTHPADLVRPMVATLRDTTALQADRVIAAEWLLAHTHGPELDEVHRTLARLRAETP